MSPKQLIPIALLFLSGSLFSQNYYKVDQNPDAPGGDNVYSDLQACIDAASDGDIIHIIPAEAHYGNVIVDKELHFKGAGYVSDNPSGFNSKVETMVLQAPLASGTTVNALVFTNSATVPIRFGLTGEPTDTLSNIEIYNCKVPGMGQMSNCYLKNTIIRNNIITNLNFTGPPSLEFQTGAGRTQNLLIANNIIGINIYYGTYEYNALSAANETLITNNLFFANDGYRAFKDLIFCNVSNNVFFGASPASQYSASSYGNIYSNNLSIQCASGGCEFPPGASDNPPNTGSGNLSNVNPYYENMTDGWYWNMDYDLTLLDISPLIDAGSDGTDIGLTGGPYPFHNYQHLRDLPYVHEMDVTGTLMENQDAHLNAEGRTNQ